MDYRLILKTAISDEIGKGFSLTGCQHFNDITLIFGAAKSDGNGAVFRSGVGTGGVILLHSSANIIRITCTRILERLAVNAPQGIRTALRFSKLLAGTADERNV